MPPHSLSFATRFCGADQYGQGARIELIHFPANNIAEVNLSYCLTSIQTFTDSNQWKIGFLNFVLYDLII